MSTDAVKRDENGTAAPLNGENKNFIEYIHVFRRNRTAIFISATPRAFS